MYKIIDPKTWNRKSSYDWFNSFEDATYSITIKMDCTDLVKYSKETKTSFFVNILYLITTGLSSVDELRTRIVNGEIRVYDVIDPTYTVTTKHGTFDNAKSKFYSDYPSFYKAAKEEVDRVKNEEKMKEGYNDSNNYDEYYMTCIPWLFMETMTHPTGVKDKSSQSVPRVCWDKYNEVNGRYEIRLNVTVSHVVCDGKPLCEALNSCKKRVENCLKYLK